MNTKFGMKMDYKRTNKFRKGKVVPRLMYEIFL